MQLGIKPKILVVEDEPDARQLYQDVLISNGYDVDSVIDGQDAIEKAALVRYDMILLDIITPRKDGIETLAEIKDSPEKFGTPKIVMLSNIAGELAIEKAMELGADGYMLKSDVEPQEMISVIQKFFE